MQNKSFQIFIKMINKYCEETKVVQSKKKMKLRESLMKNLTCHVLFSFFFLHSNMKMFLSIPRHGKKGKFLLVFVWIEIKNFLHFLVYIVNKYLWMYMEDFFHSFYLKTLGKLSVFFHSPFNDLYMFSHRSHLYWCSHNWP